MKSKLLYICIILLVLTEFFILRLLFQQKEEITIKDNYIADITAKHNAMETLFKAQMVNAGVMIDGAYLISDTISNISNLSSMVSKEIKGNFLICRYSEKMCQQCIDHTISVITDNKDSIDISRVVFMADYGSKRSFKAGVLDFSLQDCHVFNCPNLGIPAEEAMFPYIMAVDSSLRVLSVYFPTKSTHGTDYDYRHVKYMYDKLIR